MKSLRTAFALLALAALSVAGPSERIIGGSYTSDGDYPEVVSVYTDPLVGGRRHLCGGIIVNDNHVLTTATCVEGEGTLYLHVMGAGSNLDGTSGYEEYKNVNEIFIHENYEAVTHTNDLAILRLSHNFVFVSGLISPAVLPPPDTPEPATGTVVTVVGWGQDGPDGVIQSQQKAVNLTYMSQVECADIYGMFVQPNEGCLQSTETEGVCVGDEGALVRAADGTALAMVSWHLSCNDYPAVVNLLAPYYDWIVGHFES